MYVVLKAYMTVHQDINIWFTGLLLANNGFFIDTYQVESLILIQKGSLQYRHRRITIYSSSVLQNALYDQSYFY